MTPRPVPGRTRLQRLRRWCRYLYLRLVRVGGDPVHIGLGFALGVFLGVFPTFGIGIPAALGLATLLQWNRAAAMLGTLVMNPLTTPFFWSLSGTVGALVFGIGREEVFAELRNGGIRAATKGSLVYLTGNTILAFFAATISYFLAVRAVRLYREERQRRREERKRGTS